MLSQSLVALQKWRRRVDIRACERGDCRSIAHAKVLQRILPTKRDTRLQLSPRHGAHCSGIRNRADREQRIL